jgi:hypothetical protein
MTLSLKRDLEVKKGAAVIDIETEPIKDSPLKHLRIKTIQVDNEHFSSVELKRPRVLRVFSREKWIAYNAPPPARRTTAPRSVGQGLSNRPNSQEMVMKCGRMKMEPRKSGKMLL